MKNKKISSCLIAFILVFGIYTANLFFSNALAKTIDEEGNESAPKSDEAETPAPDPAPEAVPQATDSETPGSKSAGGSGSDSGPIFADDVSKCGYGYDTPPKPINCLFLEEPIGGKPYWDLYTVHCEQRPDKSDPNAKVWKCMATIWSGGSIPEGDKGPVQAILTADASKQYQGPFTLLYNYIRLIYNYMSGIIIGVSVLFIVIGGIQITLYGAKEDNLNHGKARIVKAIIGLIIWFTASLILYTINPTFFTFN